MSPETIEAIRPLCIGLGFLTGINIVGFIFIFSYLCSVNQKLNIIKEIILNQIRNEEVIINESRRI